MRDNNIKKRILEMAEKDVPDIRHRIKNDARYVVPKAKKRFDFSFFNRRPLQFASGLFILVIALFIALNQSPQTIEASSTVYLDINPSMEIDLDENDDVLTIRGKNVQANEMITLLQNYRGESINEVIDQIIALAISLNYLNEENPYIMIDVDSESTTIRDHVLAIINERIPEIAQHRLPNMEMIPGNARNQTPDEIDDARDNQVSLMKYRLIQQVLEVTDEYTREELYEMSIGELRRLISNSSNGNVIPNIPILP